MAKRYSGKKPRDDCWRQIGTVEDKPDWLVFIRPATDSDWMSVKVVADGRAVGKANYWLGWNGSRFSRQADLVLLMDRPKVLQGVEHLLRDETSGLDLL